MSESFFVAGHVLAGGRFLQGYVEVLAGRVIAIKRGLPPMVPLAEGIVLPGLYNAHTHVGDAAVPPPPPELGPAQVFPPPHGYKHRMLGALPKKQLEVGMTRYLDAMTAHGNVEHVDFREGGLAGVELLQYARRSAFFPPRCRVFGRPSSLSFDSQELGRLLAAVDGIGLSAAMDWPREPIRDVVAAAHDFGLPVALHCSESTREDLSWVLELEPAFLVHMVFGTRQDFRDLAAAGVPVVVCPRSTHRFTRVPPVVEMAKAGMRLRIGTDNAMLQGPSVLDDVAFLLSLPDVQEALDPMDVLAWALPPAKGSNTKGGIGVVAGSRDLVVLPSLGQDPLSFLQGTQERGADLVMNDGKIWRR